MSEVEFKPGAVIADRFRIGPLVGTGTFGVVYVAYDLSVGGQEVALKTMRPKGFRDRELVARFAREVSVVSQLDHPNTARLIHIGTLPATARTPSRPFMVTELVRGLPLGGLIQLRGGVELAEAVHISGLVLDSLHEAHMLGVIHRDVRPNNILIVAPKERWSDPTEGPRLPERLGVPGADDPIWRDLSLLDVKVVDFGLAKILDTGDGPQVRKLTRAGVVAGTPEYMSPEQSRGQLDLDQRSDIYGVAMLLFALLAGDAPYQGRTKVEVLAKHVSAPVPTLPGPLASQPIQAVFAKAAAKAPDDRYASADAMAWALRAAIDADLDVHAAPAFDRPPATRPQKPAGFLSRLFGAGKK